MVPLRFMLTCSLLFSFVFSVRHRQFACIKSCRCTRQKQDIHCSNDGLTHLLKFSPLTKTLVLDDNHLTKLDFDQALNYTNENFVLMELSIRRNNLTSSGLTQTSFERFEELKFLHLDGNKLTYLVDGLFHNNPLLERLTLSNNPLRVHDSSAMLAFGSAALFESLKYLDLSKTLIADKSSLVLSFLSNMSALEELILHSAHLKNVSIDTFSSLNSLQNLRHLDLSEATIDFLEDDAFFEFNDLHEFDLSGASISAESLANIFRSLNNSMIEVLNVDRIFVGNNSGLRITHDLFHRFNASHLKVLNFDGNFMAFKGRLPERLLHPLHHLEHLFLENCNLMSIPTNAFQGLHALQKLSLKSNLLSCVRGSECQFLHGFPLKHLKHFDISNNRLSDVENTIAFREAVFPILEFLDLKFNNLATISGAMFESLHRLNRLDLSNNPIEEIEPNSFVGLPSLTTLNLEGCKQLTRLKHGAFNDLRFLKVLNLRDSGLTYVHHAAFTHLGHLEELNLRRNKFSETKDQLENVTMHKSSLKTLDIGENGLKKLPIGLLRKSFGLLTLYADGNHLRDCNELKAVASVNTLETLDLSNNNMADISKECFEMFTNLKSLDLSGNPFACTCATFDIATWLSSSGLLDSSRDEYRCASPVDKINVNVFHQQPSSMECQEFREALFVVLFTLSLSVIVFLFVALCCVLRRKAPTSLPKISQSNTRSSRMDNFNSVYTPLDEEDVNKNLAVFQSCGRQSVESSYNDECHYFDNDYQSQALVDTSKTKDQDSDEGRNSKCRGGIGFFRKHKSAQSQKPYANGVNSSRTRPVIDSEASCALTSLKESKNSCSKISSLGTIDRKHMTLELTSNSQDIHVEDSVL